MLIKMHLNETYSEANIGKNMSDYFPIQNGLKTRECFITIAFWLCLRICHQEGPRKSGRFGIEWNTSACGLCC